MSLVLVVSILLRLAALLWAVVLMRRTRDWRLGFFAVMFALMMTRQSLTLIESRESWTLSVSGGRSELPGLVVSVMALAGIIALGHSRTMRASLDAQTATGRRLRTFVEAFGDAVVWAMPGGAIMYINAAGRRMLELGDDEDVSRLVITDLLPAHEAERIRGGAIPEALREGVWRGESTLVARSGRLVRVAHVMTIHRTPDGAPEYMASIMRDITAEEDASEARRLVERLTENLPGVVYRTGLREPYLPVFVSEQITRIAGYEPDELLSGEVSFVDLIHPEDAERVGERMAAATSSPGTYEVEYRIRHRSGETRWVWDRWIVVCSDDGVPLFFEGFLMNVTDLREANLKLRQLTATLEERVEGRAAEVGERVREVERLNAAMINLAEDLRATNAELEATTRELAEVNTELEAFAYSASHDLRAPLRGIDGFARVLEEDLGDRLGEEGGEHVRKIRAEARRMGQLIDDILMLSRASRSAMQWGDVDLSTLASEVVSGIRRREPERVVDVEIADGLVCRGDARLLRLALENLLENAWLYTSHGESARIRLEAAPESAPGTMSFRVRDNGVGFDMAYADRIFGVFERLHFQDEFPGTGIGLATVRRVVERHGGSVRAEGAEGVGATFQVTLPREASSSREAAAT